MGRIHVCPLRLGVRWKLIGAGMLVPFRTTEREAPVSVAKIIELTSESPDGFDDAVRKGLAKAGETLQNIQGAWVDGQEVDIRDGTHHFRVHLKITFVLN